MMPQQSPRQSHRDPYHQSSPTGASQGPLPDSLAWSQRVMLESGQQQRFQRGLRSLNLASQPSVAHYHSTVNNPFPIQSQPNLMIFPAGFEIAPLMELSLEQAMSTRQNSVHQQSGINKNGSLNANKSFHNQSILQNIAIVDDLHHQAVKPGNNQSTGNLHGLSTSTPPLDEVNAFAPKFSATTTVKMKNLADAADTKKNVGRKSITLQESQNARSLQNKSRGQLIPKGVVVRQMDDIGTPKANVYKRSPQSGQMGDFLIQNLHYTGPFNSFVIGGQSLESPVRKIEKVQEMHHYTSKSKLKIYQDGSKSKMHNLVSSPSVLHNPKSVLKSLERQASAYSTTGFRPKTRLQEESPTHIDMQRFNEALEDLVQYRERDTLDGGRQTTARQQCREDIPQTYQDISQYMGHLAPQGPNPVQKSLLLLSKCSLNMSISQEHQKIAQRKNFQQSPLRSARQKSRLKSPPVVSPSQATRMSSKGELNRNGLSTTRVIQKGGFTMKNGAAAYNVKAPEDRLRSMLHSESKMLKDNTQKSSKTYQGATFSQAFAQNSSGDRKITRSSALGQTQLQPGAASVRLLGRTARTNLPITQASSPITTRFSPTRKQQLPIQLPLSPSSPRSFPLHSQNADLYLGKSPLTSPRQSQQQQLVFNKQNIKSSGKLKNIHILRPKHIALTTQAQISRPKRQYVIYQQQYTQGNLNLLRSTSISRGDIATPGTTTQNTSQQNLTKYNTEVQSQPSLDAAHSLFRSKISETSLHRGMVQGSNFVGAMKIQSRYQLK